MKNSLSSLLALFVLPVILICCKSETSDPISVVSEETKTSKSALEKNEKPKKKAPHPAPDMKKIVAAIPIATPVAPQKPRKILVYSKPSSYKHKCIPTGNALLKAMAEKTKAFSVDFSDDVKDYNSENLKKYDAILVNNATHIQKAFTDDSLKKAFISFIENGGGFIGIHAASDGGYEDWPEYTAMIGGSFDGHPWNSKGTWGISNEDPEHPLLKSFEGKNFMIKDELYKFKDYDRTKLRVLLSINTSVSPKGKAQRPDNDHAVVWVREHGKGRVFYSSMGHNDEVFWNPQVVAMWLAGFQYALGDFKIDTTSLPLKK